MAPIWTMGRGGLRRTADSNLPPFLLFLSMPHPGIEMWREGGGAAFLSLLPSPHPPVLAFSAVLQSSLLQGDKEEKVRSSRKRQHGVDSRAESGSQTRWERREAQRQPAERLSPRGVVRGTGVPAYGAGSRRCSVKSATLLLKLILRH